MRDRLQSLNAIKEKKITDLNRFINADVIAVASDGIYSSVSVLIIRSGRMQGGKNYYISTLSALTADTLSEFIMRYYKDGKELKAPEKPER